MSSTCSESFQEVSFGFPSSDRINDSMPTSVDTISSQNEDSKNKTTTFGHISSSCLGNVLMLNNTNFVSHIKDVSNLSSAIVTFENGTKYVLHTVEPPPAKKLKSDDEETLKKMVISAQKTILDRLNCIEEKLENVSTRCQQLEEKIENLVLQTTANSLDASAVLSSRKGRSSQIIVAVPCQMSGSYSSSYSNENGSNPLFSNSEASYPNGSWLGDPDNPDLRVRCNISSGDLSMLNETCTTPEKMALTLLDYLFDRETQACSNISGTGKHGKLQLDPLKIYGIKCHLKKVFGITEAHWHRIKQNLDSKCRTAFRRKQRGMPLTVKSFRDRAPSDYRNLVKKEHCLKNSLPSTSVENKGFLLPMSESDSMSSLQSSETNNINSVKLEITDVSSMSLAHLVNESQVIHTEHGDIQVIHATEEQLAQLKDNHNIEILTDADVLNPAEST